MAQYNLDFGGGFALSNYLGDIGGKTTPRKDFISDMRAPHNRIGLNGFVRYKFNPLISVKGLLSFTQIVGDDKNTTYAPRRARNLSFKNNILAFDVIGQIYVFEVPALYQSIKHSADFRAFVGVGVGVLYHNPKAQYNGVWYELQPLQTEGTPYSKIALSLPMTFGAYFTFDRKHRVGFEVTYKKTTTDYLDDVSDLYGNPTNMTPIGAALSDRSGELVSDDPEIIELQSYNYGWDFNNDRGALRGDPNKKDAIISLFELQYSYVLRGKSSFYRSRYPGLFGNKHKKRRIRAKF